ncbi:MAG: hypothetical protein ACWA5A_09680 [Marinibacterium sp.]
MAKMLAILNVVAWSGFWAFGYIALTADRVDQGQMVIAMILAFVGLLTGIWAYTRLIRICEASGYAAKKGTLDHAARTSAQEQWDG